MPLRALTQAAGHPATETAQRFLAGAYDSVEAVLENLAKIRQLRREEGGGDIRGRLPANEEDLLRAAIVFAGAGMDASLKRLIQDTLPLLLDRSEQAHEEFESFATERLGIAEFAESRAVARYLTSASPRERLIDDYVYHLTGSSLQSAEEVQKVAGALGIDEAQLRRRINGLQQLFKARNEVAHELDLQRPERQGDRARRTRSIAPTENLCHEGLEVVQLIVNTVAGGL